MSSVINIGIDIGLKAYLNEIEYVVSNFANICGYVYKIILIGPDKKIPGTQDKLAIYYGLYIQDVEAPIRVLCSRNDYLKVHSFSPLDFCDENGIPFIKFTETQRCAQENGSGGVTFFNDIFFSSFWMLTGHQEKTYYQDLRGNYHLSGTFYLKNALNEKPIVSIYANIIKKYLLRNKGNLGMGEPMPLPYTSVSKRAAISLSHDVDYPEMVRWIECLRIIRKRGAGGLKYLVPIINGSCNFWKFSEWMEFENMLQAKSAFYFMGSKGSLLEYFLGRPDAFYDINTKKFSDLFSLIRDAGFEIGMHASYNAYRSAEVFINEKHKIEQASKVKVYGNRHHYWHLKPRDNQDTLKMHEKAGLLYDSSLLYEFYPGFRRGICHPFYPYDSTERRQINVLQLPPAWMDFQFDYHTSKNGVRDAVSYAGNIMNTVSGNNGIMVLDYHARGMNEIFYPRCGAWLKALFSGGVDEFNFLSPVQIANSWIEHVSRIGQKGDRTCR
jgi:hypothetical protein